MTPIYAIEPVGGFARDAYAVLQQLLAGQIYPEDNAEYVERVSFTIDVSDIIPVTLGDVRSWSTPY